MINKAVKIARMIKIIFILNYLIVVINLLTGSGAFQSLFLESLPALSGLEMVTWNGFEIHPFFRLY